jgi:predicted amidohydrolase YtcJ
MTSQIAPDVILQNGRITTLDPKKPEATSLAIKDGRILGVDDAGSHEPGPNTKVIDLKGRRVIPGLNDSHLHVIRGGLNYNLEVRWDGVPSLADGLRMLKEQAQRTPTGNGCGSWAAGANFNSPNAGCRPWTKSMLPHRRRRCSSCICIVARC